MIDYDHATNLHPLEGPRIVMTEIISRLKPGSILDVGCGRGTWIKAAQQLGVTNTLGIDGVAIPPGELLFSATDFRQIDLTTTWTLDRQFDLALCLEVAEHLDEQVASGLVESLTRHADTVLFSAASPYQPGQHHVNCQWPAYWQRLFNLQGYACDDTLRTQLWDNAFIDPWYRQNMFIASKSPEKAGHEPRISAYIHPDLLPHLFHAQGAIQYSDFLQRIIHGHEPLFFYSTLPLKACFFKLSRYLKRGHQSKP